MPDGRNSLSSIARLSLRVEKYLEGAANSMIIPPIMRREASKLNDSDQ